MKKFLLTLLILLGLGSLTSCQLNFDPVYGEHEHEITGEFGYYEQIHWNICATCDEKVDKAWHNFGPWQRVSDDSLEERRTCLCGYYETRFHSHLLTGNVLYDDNEHYEECEKCFDHVNAVAHTYSEWTVGRESTEDVQGYELQICSCGHTVYRSLPLKNHVHVWDGTYSITEDAHWKNCVKESCKMDEVDLLVPHNGGQATCTEDAVCVDCGYHYKEAFGHTEVTDVAVAPTCTESGLTEGSHCSVCNEVLVAQQTIDALGHDYESVVTNPTCTEKGYTTHTCKKGDHTYVDSYVDELGHDYNSVVTAPTCTEDGYTTYTCKNDATHTYVGDEVAATGHSPAEAVEENRVGSSCTVAGHYDSVVYCSVCDKELSRTKVDLELLPHTEETLEAVAPKCEATGLTEGKKCSVCDKVLVAQEEVAATGHSPAEAVEENRVGSSCTVAGHYDSVVYCSVCDKELSRTKVDLELLPHTEETLEAVAPKCEATGLTEGKKCSVCDKVLVAQQEIPAVGHTGGTATQTEQAICSVCGEGYGLPLVYTINKALPKGLSYITNNTAYPNPSFYKNSGLKMNYENMGILSETFKAEKVLTVVLNVLALNENEKTGSSEKYFTVYGLDAEGNIVAEAALTSVAVGNINSVVLTSESANIVQVKVMMTGYPHNGNKHCNVNLGGMSIYSGELASEEPETITNIKDALLAEDGSSLEIEATVVSIKYAWSDSSSNMSVYLRDDSTTDVLYVYKLATKVSLGDVIKVIGTLGSYEGTKQIVAGATAEIVSSESSSVNTIVDALNANPGATATLTGTVKTINTAWNSEYNNMSITLEDENGNTIYVYSLATEVEVGNNITVSGAIEYGYSSKVNQVAPGATAVINTTVTPEPEEPETGDEVRTTDYSYEFAKGVVTATGEVTLGDEVWTLSGEYLDNGDTGTFYYGFDSTSGRGYQFGKNNASFTSFSLKTNSSFKVYKIVINASKASGSDAKIVVSIGDSKVISATALTTAATNYTFETTDEPVIGNVNISITATIHKAIYIKSITIYCREDVVETFNNLQEDLDAISFGEESIESDINLTTEGGLHNSTITWKSNNSAITINNSIGTVTRPTTDTSVTLTATATLNGYSVSKTFKVTVKAAVSEGKIYLYTFSSKQFTANETKTLNAVKWTLAGNGGYWGLDTQNGKGQQFGSSSKPYKSMTLTSDSFSNVSKITINTSGASKISGTCIITVGGVQVGKISLTSSAKEYSFTLNEPLSGEIVISYTQTSSKAIYIKSLEVEYK